jgi:DNA-binding transcriptional LysR family regulator
MDKLRAMQAFVRIVERGSLTSAAESLGTSLPSVVRVLAGLEAAIDARLLHRTTRRIALTDEGREYYERCKRVLAEVEEAEASLSARRALPKGGLRVTSSVMFGRLHVAPILTDFIVRYPAVLADLLLVDRVVDLVDEGVDAGVRIGRLPDSSLVAIPVGESRRVFCASAEYLRKAGMPKAPEDLAHHRCVSAGGPARSGEWVFRKADGSEVQSKVSLSFTSNQISVALDAAVRGVGIGQFLWYQVQPLLQGGKLRRVLTDHEPAPLPVHVVYPHSRIMSANVRTFVSWAVPRLRTRLRA